MSESKSDYESKSDVEAKVDEYEIFRIDNEYFKCVVKPSYGNDKIIVDGRSVKVEDEICRDVKTEITIKHDNGMVFDGPNEGLTPVKVYDNLVDKKGYIPESDLTESDLTLPRLFNNKLVGYDELWDYLTVRIEDTLRSELYERLDKYNDVDSVIGADAVELKVTEYLISYLDLREYGVDELPDVWNALSRNFHYLKVHKVYNDMEERANSEVSVDDYPDSGVFADYTEEYGNLVDILPLVESQDRIYLYKRNCMDEDALYNVDELTIFIQYDHEIGMKNILDVFDFEKV